MHTVKCVLYVCHLVYAHPPLHPVWVVKHMDIPPPQFICKQQADLLTYTT